MDLIVKGGFVKQFLFWPLPEEDSKCINLSLRCWPSHKCVIEFLDLLPKRVIIIQSSVTCFSWMVIVLSSYIFKIKNKFEIARNSSNSRREP